MIQMFGAGQGDVKSKIALQLKNDLNLCNLSK